MNAVFICIIWPFSGSRRQKEKNAGIHKIDENTQRTGVKMECYTTPVTLNDSGYALTFQKLKKPAETAVQLFSYFFHGFGRAFSFSVFNHFTSTDK